MSIGKKEEQKSASSIQIATSQSLPMMGTFPILFLKSGMSTNRWTVSSELEKTESSKRWWLKEVATVPQKDLRKQEARWKKQIKNTVDLHN